MKPLNGRALLILAGNDYEDLELWYPRLRLAEAGAAVTTAAADKSVTCTGKHGYPCPCDASFGEVSARSFDGVVIPGGWMPDRLRRDPRVLAIVREIAAADRLVASICHGPWINVSAGLCRGVRMTSSAGIQDDLVNAGAAWVDEPVVVDRNFITSRKPDDLPAFCAAIIAWFESPTH
jgi:protease I